MAVTTFFYHSLILLLVFELSSSTSFTKSENIKHECSRRCSATGAKKLCKYEFKISELPKILSSKKNIRLDTNAFLLINGKSPGPVIEVCLGDTVDVHVYNKLKTEEISFHWHGIRQNNTAHMDGVPMVTQCPILPYSNFRYTFKTEKAGTHIYYAHSVSQQGDGLFGALVVRESRDKIMKEEIILISTKSPSPISSYSYLDSITPTDILVNGQKSGKVIKVKSEEEYLLRFANAIAFNCPVSIFSPSHTMTISKVESNSIQTTNSNRIILFPGERVDVILKANRSTGKYNIRIEGLQDCRSLINDLPIVYDGTDSHSNVAAELSDLLNESEIFKAEEGIDCNKISENTFCTMDAIGLIRDQRLETEDKETIYISYDTNIYTDISEDLTDHTYNIYDYVFYPSYLSMETDGIKIPQVNGMSFKYPSSPLLSQPENTPEKLICSLEKRSSECSGTPAFCECLQILSVSPNKTIEVVLIDEGFNGNSSLSFHLHGYDAFVTGRKKFDHSVTKEEIILLDRNGKLHRNYISPLKKDTFIVPNKGYSILQFHTDNRGYWIWEVRSTAISPGNRGPGIAFLMKVGDGANFPPVPLNFPTCGSNKGPDMIFEDN